MVCLHTVRRTVICIDIYEWQITGLSKLMQQIQAEGLAGLTTMKVIEDNNQNSQSILLVVLSRKNGGKIKREAFKVVKKR